MSIMIVSVCYVYIRGCGDPGLGALADDEDVLEARGEGVAHGILGQRKEMPSQPPNSELCATCFARAALHSTPGALSRDGSHRLPDIVCLRRARSSVGAGGT